MFKDVSICSKSDCWLPKNVVNTLKIFRCCYQDQEDVMDTSSSDVIINPFSTSLCFSFVCSSVGMLILGDWPKWSSTHFSITMVKKPKMSQKMPEGVMGTDEFLLEPALMRCSVCPWGPVSTYSGDSPRCKWVSVMCSCTEKVVSEPLVKWIVLLLFQCNAN